MAFMRGRGGGEIEVERGDRVPVQHDVKDRVTTTTRVRIPFLQALLVGLFLALDFAAALLAIWALGPLAALLAGTIIAVTSYIWFTLQASRWRSGVIEALSDWTYPDDLELLPMMRRIKGRDIFAGMLYSVLGAGIAHCFWLIASRTMSSVPSPGDWGWMAVLPFLFCSAVLVLVSISYVQQLVQYSPYMQQYGWAGFFSWLFQHRLTRRPEAREPMIVRGKPTAVTASTVSVEPEEDIDDGWYAVPAVGSEEWRATVTPETLAGYELQEFLVRGQTEAHPRGNGASPRGYGRNNWVGAVLRCSGRRVSQVWWTETTRILRDAGWVDSEPGMETVLVDSLAQTLEGLRLPPAEGIAGAYERDRSQRIAAAIENTTPDE